MKCDELKKYKAYEFGTSYVYHIDEVDAAIAELKQKIEDAQATAYTESVDAGMRERRLKERIAELEKENESLKYSVADLETDLAMATRWRKVSEELPEDDKPYLVYLEGGFYDVDTCDVDTKVWRYRTTVTHWMPLPKAPEVK